MKKIGISRKNSEGKKQKRDVLLIDVHKNMTSFGFFVFFFCFFKKYYYYLSKGKKQKRGVLLIDVHKNTTRFEFFVFLKKKILLLFE